MDLDKAIAQIRVERPEHLYRDGMVVKAACDAKFWFSMERGDYWADPHSADAPTKARWTVNYIRHNLTNYDTELYKNDGDAYDEYKAAVLDAIADEYPFLEDECERQKSYREG